MTDESKCKEYGSPDSDSTAYDLLREYTKNMVVVYIMHHPRVPIDARACQMPQSLKVQAVMAYGNIITSTQMAPGLPAKISE